MKLVLIGTGPTEPVIGKGKNNRLNSGAVIEHEGTFIMIDAPQTLEEQAKKFNVIENVAHIILSHGHNDATLGISCFDKIFDEKPIIHCEKETAERIREDIKEPFAEFEYFEEGKEFMIDDLKILPFRVQHSIQPGFPCVGFRIRTENETMVYSEDVDSVPEENKKYYNADVVVFDAAMWFGRQIKGHQSVETALEFLKQFDIKKIILTQAGHTYPNYDTAVKEIEEYWNNMPNKSKARILLAYDGMVTDIGMSMTLADEIVTDYEGLFVNKPHAEWLWNGYKKLIVKPKMYRFAMGKEMYWLDNEYCYGVLKLKKVIKLSPDSFNQLRTDHRVSNDERISWWKTANKILYGYEFEIIDKFEKPKKVSVPFDVDTFVRKVNFTNAVIDETLIKNITDYDPSKIGNQQLADDWRIVCAWYASKKSGVKMKFSIEDIVNIGKLIYDEIQKRVKKGTMKHEFNPKDMAAPSKELLKIVSKGVLSDIKPFGIVRMLNSSMLDGLTYFNNIDCLCNQLYGSDAKC